MKIDYDATPKILIDFYNYIIYDLNYSSGTAEEYFRSVLFFLKFYKYFRKIEIDLKDFELFIILNVKGNDIVSFMVFLNTYRDNKANTRNLRLKAIRCFYNYVFDKYSYYCINKENPTENILQVQPIKKLPRYLDLDDCKKIMNIFNSNNSREPLRNNLIIRTFLTLGIRRSELINIDLCDINFQERSIKIKGKGSKERIIFFPDTLKKAILEYLDYREIEDYNAEEPLFISRRKKRFYKKSINEIIKNAYILMGLEEKNYTVHTLRHTAATMMYLRGNGDIRAIQKVLGHESISSTEIYTHLESDNVRKAINSNPLANFYKKEKGGINSKNETL